MSRRWLEVGGQPAYQQLCGAIVALGRAGVARLVGRDVDPLTGEAARASPDPSGMMAAADGRRAAPFASCVAELQAAWHAAEAVVPGGGPLGRLGRLLRVSDSFVETVLFALIAAPALDRGIARRYAALEPAGITAGLVLDLTSTLEPHRFALAAALHPDAALRRSAVVRIAAGDPEAGPDAGIVASTVLSVAPAAIAVLRCEPVPLPTGAIELWPVPPAGPAAAALAALAVALLQRGGLTAIVAGDGPGAAAIAIARLLAAAEGSGLWLLPADRPEPPWSALVRDTTLANAIAAVPGPPVGPWLDRVGAICDRAMGSLICVVPSPPRATDEVAVVDLAEVRQRARGSAVQAALGDPAVAALLAVVAGR